MTTLSDLGVSAGINIATSLVFLLAFAILRLQPINDMVYYPKWYIKRVKKHESDGSRRPISALVNLDWRVYLHFLDWTKESLKMPEQEIVDHAGLDSAIYLRIYILGLKLFLPLFIFGAAILFPVNGTDNNLNDPNKLLYSNIDKLSISNVMDHSKRLWTHICLSYVFTAWICGVLYKEYWRVTSMRLQFNNKKHRRPDQFTVLVKNIPPDPDESVSLHVEHFFRVNHPDYYLTHQVVCNANQLEKLMKKKEKLQNRMDYYQIKYLRGPEILPTTRKGFLGLWGEKVDAIQYYSVKIEEVTEEINKERNRILEDPKALLPVAFVSFKRRWGAAVAAQTQQSMNPTIWLTEWAPEPRDVYWRNLAIPFVELSVRKLLVVVAFFFLLLFFMVPVSFVNSLANLKGLSQTFPFLKPLLNVSFVSSFLQGFLPGLALKIFLLLLPFLLMLLTKIEGYTSLSSLERRSGAKFFVFLVVAVFCGSIFTGTASQQLHQFLEAPPSEIPNIIGNSVAQKALFFVTYIMVDGWAGIAAEVLRLRALIVFHLWNMFLVKTDKDREKAMDPGSISLDQSLPKIELYFLFGIVYAEIAPILLPFIIVYFAFAYLVYRNQVINVYEQRYESAGAFWPHLHTRIMVCLIVQQVAMIGILATKEAENSTPILLLLPVLTVSFHMYCKRRFEPAFRKYPLEEAMAKDTIERAVDPNFDLKSYLKETYLHPAFKEADDVDDADRDKDPPLVETRNVDYKSPV